MLMLPREHGAWGLLLMPFVCAAVLARRAEWLLLPALGLALLGFVMREPLIALARQRWVWREEKAESALARRCLAWQLPLGAALWAALAWKLPIAPLAALSAVALGVTGLAIWMTMKNRQRSVGLQLLSSVGLGTTALLAALAATGAIPAWAWWLWGVLAAHGMGSILVVRARLEARTGAGSTLWWAACGFHVIAGALAAVLALTGRGGLGVAVGVSALAGLWELANMRRPEALSEPLKRVGWRTLAVSLGQGCLTVAALW